MKEELRAQYVKSLESRIETIDTLKDKFYEGNEFADQNIRLLAHQLHGSGSTFGFHAITKASAVLESAKEDDLVPKMMELRTILEKIIKGYSVAFPDKIAATNAAPVYEKKAGEKLVLIIEDNPTIVAQVKSCLSQQPGTITTVIAEDAQHAEDELLKGDYDLAIVDLVLPDKDGREILREIKIDFQLAFPVIILSGISKDLVRVDCMSLGADRYIAKPFDTDKLYFEAQQILQNNRLQVVSSGSATSPKTMQAPQDMSLKGVSILVAEDDEIQAIFITHKLADHGADVTHVENGQLALDALEKNSYSAVILDGKMPVMDGFETFQSIRRNSRLKGLPVIMVTAMGSEENIVKGYELGANDYILKPFSEEQLVNRIKSLLVMAA